MIDPSHAQPGGHSQHRTHKPSALIVLLENVGYVSGIDLPGWAMSAIDFLTEEYAKALLHVRGAYRRYDRVVVLEDEKATGSRLIPALLETSRTHRIDQLHLVHGRDRALVGYRGEQVIDWDDFAALRRSYRRDPQVLDLRMIYGLNCYGASLAPMWMDLGVRAVNGAAGVNWLPEPSLNLFLSHWLAGATFGQAVVESHLKALHLGTKIWRPSADGQDDPHIAGSRQIIYGRRDVTITSQT